MNRMKLFLVCALALPVLANAATTVDVLVAYDAPAAAWVAGERQSTPESFASDAIGRMNEVLKNSQMDSQFTFRLAGVCTVETDVCGGVAPEAAGPKFEAALAGMPEGKAPWGGVKALRDQVAADLVVVLADTGDRYGVTGLGNSLKTDAPIADYAPYAYCICSVRSVAESYTMMHEVGHLMGAGHPDSDPFGQGFAKGPQYGSAAAAFTDLAHSSVTVMGYSGNGCKVIPYFSSPLLTVDGVAIGDAKHDNRQTLLGTYEQVSQYRTASSGGTSGDAASAAGGFNPKKATVLNGAYLEGESVRGVLQVKVGKASRNASKVSVTVIGLDGKKYTSKAVKVSTGGTQTQTFEMKKLGSLTLTFGENGFSGTLNGGTVVQTEGRFATTRGHATFTATDLTALPGAVATYFPTDETVSRTEKKWAVVAKAGKLKYVILNKNDGLAGTLAPTGSNIAGLKLTYAPKAQTFKGSFKVWLLDESKGKLKSASVKVTGVVVDGTGYGEVTYKKGVIGELTVR